jgi:soluble lytic murein transglycosylase-like protein
LRKRKRDEAIVAGEGGSFSAAPNANANPNAPWYEYLARSNVRDYAGHIEQVAKEEGIDPDLIRAVMFMETTHGNYGGLGPMADALGRSDTILPMNMNVRYWGNNFGSRAELNDPLNNIRGGARMLKNIIGNFESPASIATIGTLYNDSNATRVSDYGARLDSIYKTRPWEREQDFREPDFLDDFLARQPF